MRRLKKVLRNKWQRTWAQCDLGDVKIPRWLAGTSLLSTSHVCLCACCVTNWLKKKIILSVVCVWVTHTVSADTVTGVKSKSASVRVTHTGPRGQLKPLQDISHFLVFSPSEAEQGATPVRHPSWHLQTKNKWKEAWLSASGALWQQGWVWITVARLSSTLLRCLADTVPFMGFLLISAKAVKQAGKPSAGHIKPGFWYFFALIADRESLFPGLKPFIEEAGFSHNIWISVLKDSLNIVEREKKNPCCWLWSKATYKCSVFPNCPSESPQTFAKVWIRPGRELSSRQALKRKGLGFYHDWHCNSGRTVGYGGNYIFPVIRMICC